MSEPSGFREIVTFTGDTLRYNAVEHRYETLDGEPLLSGSKYAEEFASPFDKERALKHTAKKLKTTEAKVEAAWEMKGLVARTFGTALHLAMECWYKHKDLGYGMSKHPFLENAVKTFPFKDKNVIPEIMVSDLSRGLVGQIDGLLVQDLVPSGAFGVIIDYKSDATVEKNLKKHFNQLSFYAHILKFHGWQIPDLQVWNFTDRWQVYHSPVLPLKLGVE